jgi:hemerythrin-like domain-containing protein
MLAAGSVNGIFPAGFHVGCAGGSRGPIVLTQARAVLRKPELVMHSLIAELHQDHVNLNRLLKLLERELESFRRDQPPDYYLLLDLVEYVESYPDLIHHPREDVIFRVYLENYSEGEQEVRRLMEEHRLLVEQSQQLRHVLEQALHGVVVSRMMVEESLSRYLDIQRAHLDAEEGNVFPLLESSLQCADWERIQAAMPVSSDPLFGGSVQKRYQSVFDQIITLS